MNLNNGTGQENLDEKEPYPDNKESKAIPADDILEVQSENVSPPSQKASDRQTRRRGGRKPKGRYRTTSGSRKPWSERNGRLEQPSEFESASDEEIESQDTKKKDASSASEKDHPKPFETGVRSFNLKRADSTGGSRRPIGVTIDGGKSNSKKGDRKQKKKSKGKESRRQENSEDEDSESEAEPEKRKPLAIRLDLNLELEVFLRAKVKGDITITFLE